MESVSSDIITIGAALFVIAIFIGIGGRILGSKIGDKIKEWIGWD